MRVDVAVVNAAVADVVEARAPVVRVVTAYATVRSTATTLAQPVPRRYPC